MKTFLFTITFTFLSLVGFSKDLPYGLNKETQEYTVDTYITFGQVLVKRVCADSAATVVIPFNYKNDTVSILITPFEGFWSIWIWNYTKEKMIVYWDESYFIQGNSTSGIVFDNTIRLNMDRPQGESVVLPETRVYKKIAPKENFEYSSDARPICDVKKMLEYGERERELSLILTLGVNGVKREYRLDYVISLSPALAKKIKTRK